MACRQPLSLVGTLECHRTQGQLELLGSGDSIERRSGIPPGVGAVLSVVCLGRVWHTYAQGLCKSGEDFSGCLQLPFPFLSSRLLLSSQERKVTADSGFCHYTNGFEL